MYLSEVCWSVDCRSSTCRHLGVEHRPWNAKRCWPSAQHRNTSKCQNILYLALLIAKIHIRRGSLLVVQQSSYYLRSKKLLGNHGPQVGNFPNPFSVLKLPCKECSGCFNITMAWQDSAVVDHLVPDTQICSAGCLRKWRLPELKRIRLKIS